VFEPIDFCKLDRCPNQIVKFNSKAKSTYTRYDSNDRKFIQKIDKNKYKSLNEWKLYTN